MKQIDPSLLSIAFSKKELCTRSGTCVAVCPTKAISVGKDFYPELNSDLCIECGLCAKTCPGGKVNFRDLTQITFGHRNEAATFDGHVQRTLVGYAGDAHIRKGGAGGGVITALMWDLLNRGVVDGCIVTRMMPEKPWLGEVFIARTYEELLQSQQSKYIIIPVNAILTELRHLPGKYALAALPCQIHGYRLFAEEEPFFKEKIHVVIGLFCASALEPNVATEMMEARGINPTQIKNFEFRGGGWPGKIRATLPDGQIKNLHYSNFKDGAINYLTYLYSPFRCQTCIDGASEFADISVSDAWTRDEGGNYLFESHSKLLARTEVGCRVLEQAMQSGALVAKDVTQNKSYITHKLHTKKKGMKAPLRVERLHRQGKSAPVYDRVPPKADKRELLGELIESFIMFLGRRRSTRFPLFKFLTSRYGIPIVNIRQYIKSRKYRKK
jgi:coenzyme F420 hydrogenase subunit beta